jgi:hypothetical protein
LRRRCAPPSRNTVSAGSAPHTALRGDLGVKAPAQPTGFPPGIVTGALARTTVGPGLHTIAGAVSNTTTVTLDAQGDPNAIFVFQVNGAGAVGANAGFAGTMIALNAVAVGNGSVVNGRTFALIGALTLDANEFYSAPPVVTIDGGDTAITTDTTPTVSGTTNLDSAVTVTIGDQTFTTMPSAGAWSVRSAILANDIYPVAVSGADGAGNAADAAQRLTVDTVLPVVSIEGGASVTNDSTPTISGTTDVAPGSIVRVRVGSEDLTALVHTGGTWNVTPSALSDGTRTVTASVTDAAGNDGDDTESLTVDTVSPDLGITGGDAHLSNDDTPEISGTAAVAPGTMVTVTLADETLTGPVASDGTWSVTASALSDGPHRIVASVSDAAGNSSSTTQTLTVDTASPAVAISGGEAATTSDISPTLTGTFDAAPGTIVTVSIAGQTMTTLLQTNGTWNATPNAIGEGTWPVVASAPDPAGNVGVATQMLTVRPAGPAPTSTPTPTAPTPAAPSTSTVPSTPAAAASNAVATTAVAGNASQKLSGSSLSIATKVTAPAAGNVVATATGTVRIAGVKQAISLKSAAATVGAGRSATLKLTAVGTKKAITAAIKKLKKATATITVKVVDAAGNARVVTRTVKLRK